MSQATYEYIGFYTIGIFICLLGLVTPWLATPYMLLFFGASINLIFTWERTLLPDPEHSGKTYFERHSRWNYYSYALSILFIIATILVVVIPINKYITTLVIWSICLWIVIKLNSKAKSNLVTNMIIDYVSQQEPNLPRIKIKEYVYAWVNGMDDSELSKLSKRLEFTKSDIMKINHYITKLLS